MRCPDCGTKMLTTLDEPMGATYICPNCEKEYDVKYSKMDTSRGE